MNALILAAVITANLAEPVPEPSFPDGAEARQELLWQDYTNRQWQVYRNKVRAAEARAKREAAELHEAEEMLTAELLAVLPVDGLDALELCDGKQALTLRWSVLGEGYNAFLKKLFSAGVRKIGYHVKDLMGLLLAEKLPTEGFVFDAALAAYATRDRRKGNAR